MFSDDGKCVSDPLLMRRALEYVKAFDGVIAQHAQEPRLTEGAQMNEGAVSGELGLAGWPAVAEEAIIARDVLLAEHVGSRLHVCHVSTAGSVEIIRWAKARGIDVTAEVTPHHLLLTDELVRGYDPVYKVNPPLRTAEDVAGAARGRSPTARSTSSPPTTRRTPSRPRTASGTPRRSAWLGLETALSVVQAADGRDRPARLGRRRRRMSRRARRASAASPATACRSRSGEPANLVLFDPAARRTVDPATTGDGRRGTRPTGRELPGRVVATFLRGHPTVLDGALAEPVPELEEVPA